MVKLSTPVLTNLKAFKPVYYTRKDFIFEHLLLSPSIPTGDGKNCVGGSGAPKTAAGSQLDPSLMKSAKDGDWHRIN